MARHFLQGCPHEDDDPVTWCRHWQHIGRILFVRIGAALTLLFILAVVMAVMP